MKERGIFFVGNWKMYKTAKDAREYIKKLAKETLDTKSTIYLAVPFTAISEARDEANKTSIVIGAQNMHDATEGAFTGEIAAKMLLEAGAQFVILGHSERRRYFNETNQFINRKVKSALKEKLQPILCIGETLDEREANRTEEILKQQIEECLQDVNKKEITPLILSYEPVWAIGTDKTATPEIANEAIKYCRVIIKDLFGEAFAKKIPILYGGSVKPENSASLLKEENIDGFLVGGACLSVDTFVKIIKNLQ